MGVGQPSVGGAIPGQVVLGSVRKQAEQATRSQPVKSAASLCISPYIWVLSLPALSYLLDDGLQPVK